jgi:hypothetical protein
MAGVYSFLDTYAAISGPSAAFDFGAGSDNSEGGISVVMTEDKNSMTIGADAGVMHNLHAGKSGTVTIRLLKTSPDNLRFSAAYAAQTESAANHGQNTITIRNPALGDHITCRECAFSKFADITYGKDGGEMVWTFHAGKIDFDLGNGFVAAA